MRAANAERIFANGRPIDYDFLGINDNGEILIDEYVVEGTPQWRDVGEPIGSEEWIELGVIPFPGTGSFPDTGVRVDQRVDVIYQHQVLWGNVVRISKVGEKAWTAKEVDRTHVGFENLGQYGDAYRTVILRRKRTLGSRSVFSIGGRAVGPKYDE